MVKPGSSRVLAAALVLLAFVALGCPTRSTWPYDVQRGRTLADHTDGEAAEMYQVPVADGIRLTPHMGHHDPQLGESLHDRGERLGG